MSLSSITVGPWDSRLVVNVTSIKPAHTVYDRVYDRVMIVAMTFSHSR